MLCSPFGSRAKCPARNRTVCDNGSIKALSNLFPPPVLNSEAESHSVTFCIFSDSTSGSVPSSDTTTTTTTSSGSGESIVSSQTSSPPASATHYVGAGPSPPGEARSKAAEERPLATGDDRKSPAPTPSTAAPSNTQPGATSTTDQSEQVRAHLVK